MTSLRWRSLATSTALLCSMAASAVPAQQIVGEPQRFKAVTSMVSVDVTVLRGRTPVPGFAARDFALTDNGVPQKIESFALESIPLDVTLAIDTSSSVIANLDAFKAEVRRFAGMLRPTDRIRIVAFGTGVAEAVRMRPAGDPLDLDGLDARGATALNDGVAYALLWPPTPGRRHLVIVLTDGIDTVSTLSAEELLHLSGGVEVVVHAVLVPPAMAPTWSWQQASLDAVRALALGTGGAIHDPKSAVNNFKEIVDDFRAGYLLKFAPTGVSSDGLHELKVTLTRSDASRYTVRARKTYFGG